MREQRAGGNLGAVHGAGAARALRPHGADTALVLSQQLFPAEMQCPTAGPAAGLTLSLLKGFQAELLRLCCALLALRSGKFTLSNRQARDLVTKTNPGDPYPKAPTQPKTANRENLPEPYR